MPAASIVVVTPVVVLHTQGVITVDLETWASVLGVIVSVLAIIGYSARSSRRLEAQIADLARTVEGNRHEARADLSAFRTELKTDMTELRTELKTDMAELRTEIKTDMAELRTEIKTDVAELRDELRAEMRAGFERTDARLTVIEQRTYDLSTRLPPAPAAPRA